MSASVPQWTSGRHGERSSERQPRVLQVVDSLAPAGAQRIVLDVAELMTKSKVSITVVSLVDAGQHSLRAQVEGVGAQVVVIPTGNEHGLIDLRRLVRVVTFMRRGHFDLVQTHLCYANTIGCVAARLAGIPVVATLHSTRRQHKWSKERLEALALRSSASMVVAVGRSVAEAHRGKVGDERMVVLPNGVRSAVPLSAEQRRALRVEVSGDTSRPLLLSAGRLAPEKGFKDVIRALLVVRRHHPNVMLAVAGSGDQHGELTELISALGLGQSVRLLGWRDDLPRLLSAADGFVSGSYWEGLPIAVLQAMAAGLPVVATGVGELPLLLGEDRGLLVRVSDVPGLAGAVSALLDNPAEARRRGKAAGQHVAAHYGEERWGRSLLALYQSLVPALAWDAHLGSQGPVAPPCAG